MCLTTTRLEAIKRGLYADLERGLYRINNALDKLAPHIPEECHVHFDVQNDRITVEGEQTCPQNFETLRKLAAVYKAEVRVSWIADGWDGTFMTPHPEYVCVWVTNIGDPNLSKPSAVPPGRDA